MKDRYMRILAVVCVLFIVGAAQAAKAPAKDKSVKSVPATSTKAPTTQAGSTSTTTVESTTPADAANPAGDLAQQTSNGPRAGEQINWDVIASGGGTMSSANFILDGTLGQTVAGESSSPNFALNAGFWQNFGSGGGYLCGDVNGSGLFDIADAVFIVNYIFASGPAPNPIESGDVNCTGGIDISDVVYMINYIFAGGPAPCAACP